MRISIKADDVPADKHFSYQLDLSGKQVVTVLGLLCGTVLVSQVILAYTKRSELK